jgi:hypothetical protein
MSIINFWVQNNTIFIGCVESSSNAGGSAVEVIFLPYFLEPYFTASIHPSINDQFKNDNNMPLTLHLEDRAIFTQHVELDQSEAIDQVTK